MSKPFTGLRVLDFTQVFAGPFGTYQLALLGADVIKIERKGGENMRFSPGSEEWADRAMAPTWCAVNAGKRNIELDLKDPKAIEIVKLGQVCRYRHGKLPARRHGPARHRL